MEQIRSKPGLAKFYGNSSSEVKAYFGDLPALLEHGFSLDLLLAYMFSRVELAHVKSLYCGVVKLHKVDSGLAKRAVQQLHMTREGFREKYATIYGSEIPGSTAKLLTVAEGVRDPYSMARCQR